MRIGLAVYNFDPKKGGAERYAYDLSTRLAAAGHEVFVFCRRGIAAGGVTVVPIEAVRFPRWLRTLSFALAHRTVVPRFRLDIILCFGNTLLADVYQSHGGVQRVWMEREIASYDKPRERAWKAFLLKASIHQKVQEKIAEYPLRTGRSARVVAISEMVRGHMADRFGLPPSSFDVVYNGVDTDRFSPGRQPAATPLRILFSAGNFRLKGLRPLILSLGEIARERKDFQLTIMGRGNKGRYRALIDSLGIGRQVTFLGETGSPEKVYRQAHVLVHPTYYDACSLTTMEAMAAGLPVITTAWNGASALVGEKGGFVIGEPDDIPGLAGAVLTFFDTDRRREMGIAARAHIEQYTMERNAARLTAIFEEVRDRRRHE